MELKAKVDEKGNLSINAYDLFASLEEDIQKEIIDGLVWESPMWKEIERLVKEEYAGENYNDTIYRLRLLFLQDKDVDENIRNVIHELLTINKRLNKQLNDWRDAYYKWCRWHNDKYNGMNYEPVPVGSPKYEYVTATKTELETVLKALGITREVLEHPLVSPRSDKEKTDEVKRPQV